MSSSRGARVKMVRGILLFYVMEIKGLERHI